MENVHGSNSKTENQITVTLSTRTAFQLTFWPSLAFVLVALIAKLVH